MATPAYEGGIGGKFRTRPFRRAAETPYDRPPSAARGLRGPSPAGSSGWLSKLVDPASRFIAGSASKFFSSFTHKRLAAPPALAEESYQSRQEVSEVACTNPSSEIQDRGGTGINGPMNNSDTDGIPELEQLLKQKIFTRVEFDQLTELLRARTVEPVRLEPAASIEKKENGLSRENKAQKSRLYENFSTPAANLTIPKDEAASPVELAKAYMGFMPSIISPPVSSLRTQVSHEDADLPSIVPYVPRISNQLVAPRSVNCFSSIHKLPENGYETIKPPGRSAMCRMSCSPYFKVQPTTNIKGGKPNADGYTGPSSSQLKPRNMHSGGRQVLKRGSAVLDSDFGSFGPIRRIRQKSYLASPSKDSHSILLNKYVCKDSTSVRKPSMLDGPKYGNTGLKDAEKGERNIFCSSVAAIPLKSTETAMKILQHLDNLVASPKEKSSEPKASDSKLLGLGSSLCKNKNSVKENGSSKPAVLGVNLTSVDNAAVPSTSAKPGTGPANVAVSDSAAVNPRENPAFQMCAPEDSRVSDDDRYNLRDASGPLSTGMSAPSNHSLPPPHPTMPTPSLDRSARKKEQMAAPVSGFSSSAAGTPTFSSTPASVSDTSGQKVGAGDASTTTAMEGSNSDKGGKIDKVVDFSKSFGNAASSVVPTPTTPVFGFGASSTTSQSNGSLFPVSAAPPVPPSDSRVCSDFTASTATSTSTGTPSIAPAPRSLTASSFQFGSASSMGSTVSVSHPVHKSDSAILEANPATSSTFDIISSTSSPFTTTGMGIFEFGASVQPTTSSLSIGTSQFPQSSASQLGSLSSTPTFGLSRPPSSGFGGSPFGSATFGTEPFTSSGFPFSGGSGSSGSSPVFGFAAGSTASSPVAGISFGAQSSASSPMGSVFPFASAGMPRPAVSFSSGSPGNDQMNVEDCMTDDTNEAAAPIFPTFGQPVNLPAALNSMFGAAVAPLGGQPVFQFGGHQDPQSPFQAGNPEAPLGGSFSLGSGGGDKSRRRIVRVRRDKQRK